METKNIIKWNIENSKKEIRKSVLKDNLIIFFTRVIEDSKRHRSPNFYGRVKEIYGLLNPYSNEEDTKKIFNELRNSNLNSKDGLVLDAKEKGFLSSFLKSLDDDCKLKDKNIGEIESILKRLNDKYLPNSSRLVEVYILGKLISSVGGIDNLYRKPSSTIQLIGAEKAVFRHISKGSSCPKYGLLFYSDKVRKSKNKGKAARQLANKLAISIKQDYFQNFAR